MDIQIFVADERHYPYAPAICTLIEEAARARGTGIAKREPAYIRRKMEEGKAVIALAGEDLAGFCYIETWDHNRYVANSGLIVAPEYRKYGLARQIKAKAFELSRKKYPEAKLFGITTSLPVMKINSDLGYKPVTFSELTTDEVFWKGCQSCPNYDILTRNERRLCLCTGMLYDPASEEAKAARKKAEDDAAAKQREEELAQRWERFKAHMRKRKGNQVLQRILENLFRKEEQKISGR